MFSKVLCCDEFLEEKLEGEKIPK
ncbi:unnamed protein product [Victoria cruziana]